MVEVFKTNVADKDQANMLVDQIHKTFNGYAANFDLDDCDKILRVKSTSGFIEPALLVDFLKNFGFTAEVLPDNDQVTGRLIKMMNLKTIFN